jgi:hypothetical protein
MRNHPHPSELASPGAISVSLKLNVEGQGEILLECTAPPALSFVACNRLVETMKDKIRETRIEAEQHPPAFETEILVGPR